MISLGKKALKSTTVGIIGVLAATATLLGLHEIYVLFGAGLLGILIHIGRRPAARVMAWPPLLLVAGHAVEVSHWKLFFIFLKIGALLYGSGYVLFAFL